MVDTMARPPESWGQDPYTPRRASYYPQEQRGQDIRLPSLPSLVNGPHGNQGTPNRQPPVTYRQNAYEGHYATSSPVHQSPPPPMPGPDLHTAVPSPYVRRPVEVVNRMRPGHPPNVGDRPVELPDHIRYRQIPNEPSPLQTSRPPIQPGRMIESPRQPHYAETHQHQHQPARPSSDYSHREARVQRSPQTVNAPRQTWPPQQPESRAPERMRISELLSDEPKTGESGSSKAPERRKGAPAATSAYKLRVRQQPVAARSCGFGERDRRVIDPPPIVQVFIEDPKASQEEIRSQLKFRFSVMHCTIWNETGDQDCSGMPDDYRQQRRLMGTIVSSPFVGFDENNEEGCFFCFPDLSCRTPGTFRLRFSLVILDPNSIPGSKTPVCAIAMSEAFTVYNAKDFPGMRASTALTKRLKEQGCLISIKKGNERSHARDDSEDDDDDEEDGGGGGGGSSATRRVKRTRKS
ncbi:velvet factor-domain-containing protein [Hypoxylon trugodes]|uniref:velvet factor-domain-containing protein n=1 Tax=Hypoxylon trugodes TaxID=326681 RepID=UPI00218E1CEB|nr:velvet factor-domain-containing protein [Hypoxylon trugodes]KAI1393772.1 velvet factor-domain-containing protein [Hypoxylon trugodes]